MDTNRCLEILKQIITKDKIYITGDERKELEKLWFISNKAYKDSKDKKLPLPSIIVDKQHMKYAITKKWKKYIDENDGLAL